jgi:hypothetical protein
MTKFHSKDLTTLRKMPFVVSRLDDHAGLLYEVLGGFSPKAEVEPLGQIRTSASSAFSLT